MLVRRRLAALIVEAVQDVKLQLPVKHLADVVEDRVVNLVGLGVALRLQLDGADGNVVIVRGRRADIGQRDVVVGVEVKLQLGDAVVDALVAAKLLVVVQVLGAQGQGAGSVTQPLAG